MTFKIYAAMTRDRPIWLFWDWYQYIGHSCNDSQYWLLTFTKFLNLVFCFIIKNIVIYYMTYLFIKNLKSRFMS